LLHLSRIISLCCARIGTYDPQNILATKSFQRLVTTFQDISLHGAQFPDHSGASCADSRAIASCREQNSKIVQLCTSSGDLGAIMVVRFLQKIQGNDESCGD
jgi:hypothetical protein